MELAFTLLFGVIGISLAIPKSRHYLLSKLRFLGQDDDLRRSGLADGADWASIKLDDEKFLVYAGPYENIPVIEPEVYHQRFGVALEDGNYDYRLASEDRLSSHREKGYHVLYLTDKQSWRRRIERSGQILIGKPKSTRAYQRTGGE